MSGLGLLWRQRRARLGEQRGGMADPTAWVIWLHGLGDTGSGWASLTRTVGGRLPHLKWSFPNASTAPVSCNPPGSPPTTSWFDIAHIPVDQDEPEQVVAHALILNTLCCTHTHTSLSVAHVRSRSQRELGGSRTAVLSQPRGLNAAVSAVHAMLRQAESLGFAPSRVVLGGFSQGGALALQVSKTLPRVGWRQQARCVLPGLGSSLSPRSAS